MDIACFLIIDAVVLIIATGILTYFFLKDMLKKEKITKNPIKNKFRKT